MTMVLHGIARWRLQQDREGYREYTVVHKVRSDDGSDGPYNALLTPGLPVPGSTWNFFSDVDPYSYCKQEATVTPMVDDQKNLWYEVEQKFSNRGDKGRCHEDRIDNPLLMPQKVSGSFVKFQEEATHDRHGNRILTSSHEQVRGPQNEWDCNRPQIRIEQNVASLQLALITQMVDCVNAAQLWGLPPRTVKLSNVQWSANFYGSCFAYYTRMFEFDIRYRRVQQISSETSGTGTELVPVYEGAYETWDRNILDEGTKVLKGHWNSTTGQYVVDRVGMLAVPAAPTAEWGSDTGTLAPGDYSYKITAKNSYGETTPSDAATVTLPVPGYVLLTWEAVTGAEEYGVYRLSGGSYKLVAYTPDTTYTNAVEGSPTSAPPATNTATVYGDPDNPSHFIRYQDRNGNTARVILDGTGLPAATVVGFGTGTGTPSRTGIGNVFVEKYAEANFLLLGIPTVIG